MWKYLILLALTGCTVNAIRVHNDNGATCTVDTSTTADPEIDPNINASLQKALKQ